MNTFRYLFAIALCLTIMSESMVAQNIQSVPVNFVIRKIKQQPNNDRMRMFLDFQAETQQGLLSGMGTLSMCNCYCDSIWDAWPSEVNGGIPGTGTLHFISGQSGAPSPQIPQNGVLGIRMVEGGIERETDFEVSLKYLTTD